VQARSGWCSTSLRNGQRPAVLRYLQQHDLPLPTRLCAARPRMRCVATRNAQRVLAILHKPAYAGAYVYGGAHGSLRHRAGTAQWDVRRPAAHGPCVGREPTPLPQLGAVSAQSGRLQDNQNRYEAEHPVLAPRPAYYKAW